MNRFRKLMALVLCAVMVAGVTPAYGLSRIQGLSFSSSTEGYLAGWYPTQRGFVSYTSDGGASWTATSTGSLLVSKVAAFSGGAWGSMGVYSPKAMRVSDAGRAWNLTPANVASRAVVTKVQSVQGGRLVAVGQIENHTVGSDNHGDVAFVATSDDNGGSWTTRFAGPLYPPVGDTNPPLTEASISDVDASADGSLLIAVGNELNESATTAATFKRRLVYTSADGGSSWTTQTAAGTTRLNGVTIASSGVAYAYGDARAILKTTNGGTSWSALTPPAFATAVGNSASIAAADAFSATTLMVAGNRPILDGSAQIARSMDGGVTWTLGPVFGSALYGVQALTSAHWVAVGSNETIVHTRDGGATWSLPAGEKPPAVTLAQPVADFTYAYAPVVVSGTANDGVGDSPGVGVERVEIRIKRADGRSWNGVSWVTGDAWVRASTANGWKNWTYSWTPDSTILAAPAIVSVTARATDGIGLQRLSSTVESRGPRITVTTPKPGFYISSTAAQQVSGTVSTGGTPVQTIRFSVKRTDGRYWDNGAWVAIEKWHSIPYTAGASTWTTTWRPDSAFVKSGSAVTVQVRARDAAGNERTVSVNSTKRVKATLGRPGLKTTSLVRGRTYTASGILKPRHTAGTKPVKVYAYRYVKGKYRYYKSFSATASNYSTYSKYSTKVKLPYRGKWRLRAYHPADTKHLATYSTYRYVSVR